jgi:hypothetical protein
VKSRLRVCLAGAVLEKRFPGSRMGGLAQDEHPGLIM